VPDPHFFVAHPVAGHDPSNILPSPRNRAEWSNGHALSTPRISFAGIANCPIRPVRPVAAFETPRAYGVRWIADIWVHEPNVYNTVPTIGGLALAFLECTAYFTPPPPGPVAPPCLFDTRMVVPLEVLGTLHQSMA
jgi:hypothetical protein